MKQMLLIKRVYTSIFVTCVAALCFTGALPFAGCSYLKEPDQDVALSIKPKNNSEMEKLSSQMRFDMGVHGLLLWASLGFLMPLGILIIRMSNTAASSSSTRRRLLFYFHVILQTLAVLLLTAGAVMSIKSFENSFSNNHQRLGLALYCAIWVQSVLGFSRPLEGSRKRGSWFLLHWLMGTIILVLGITNIYTGLESYQRKTGKSVRMWVVLFTGEVCLFAVLYLLQDKWDYMKKQQGGMFGDEPVRPSSASDDQEMGNSSNGGLDDAHQRVNGKRLWGEPCSKANALKNLF